METSLGFLLYSSVWRKTTKKRKSFHLLYGRIWNFNWVCVLIFLSLSCNSMMWYELNKVMEHFFAFPNTVLCEQKTTWRSQAQWLAKFAWYDVTWKLHITRKILIIGTNVYPTLSNIYFGLGKKNSKLHRDIWFCRHKINTVTKHNYL